MSITATSAVFGLDLAKSTFHLVGLDNRGRQVCSKRLNRKALFIFLAQCPKAVIAMEACAGAHWVARKLEEIGHVTKIIPGQYVKPFAQKQKNDTNDALAIAEASQRPSVRPIQTRTADQQDIQSLHRIRERLVSQRTRLVNQMRGLLLEYGVTIRAGINHFRKHLPDAISDTGNDLSPEMRKIMATMFDELTELGNRIDEITNRIEVLASRHETARRLMTIPGIGPIFATALIASVGDGSQFRKARDLSAWLGLVPSQHSTGGKTTLHGISKRGNSYLRKMLIHGARVCTIHLDKNKDQLGVWINDLKNRKHFNKVTVALANKLARIAWVILRKPNQIYHRIHPLSV